jgi:E1A/CREB-binding protein
MCRRMWKLLNIHVQQCQSDNCSVPKCRQIKEQIKEQLQALPSLM